MATVQLDSVDKAGDNGCHAIHDLDLDIDIEDTENMHFFDPVTRGSIWS